MKISSHAAAGVVTGAAFIASAAHIVAVVDETNWIGFALAYPIGIDGLIFVGIKALQERRVKAGLMAVLIGAVYSLLFNADAEQALKMDPLLIAASMPVCLFASFVIVHTGHRVVEHVCPEPERVEVPGPERVVYVDREVPASGRVVPVEGRSGTRFVRAPEVPASPAPVRTRVPVSRGSVSWDVDLAVKLMAEGTRTDTEIGSQVGTGYKMIQRARRALNLLREDPGAEVPKEWKVPAVAVERIRELVRVP